MYNILPKTSFIGKSVFFMPSCHSTNAVAHDLLSKNLLPEGAIVITPNQTAGKGQRGNSWESAADKNITCSILLYPTFVKIEDAFDLTIFTSLALVATLSNFISLERIKIKWPNDIYVDSQKICGILIENSIQKNLIRDSVIGIGLNINQSIFENSNAISLRMVTGNTFDIPSVTEVLLENLEYYFFKLKHGESKSLSEEYSTNLYWKDIEHVFMIKDQRIHATIKGIERSGRLLVDISGNIHKFDLKEIVFVS